MRSSSHNLLSAIVAVLPLIMFSSPLRAQRSIDRPNRLLFEAGYVYNPSTTLRAASLVTPHPYRETTETFSSDGWQVALRRTIFMFDDTSSTTDIPFTMGVGLAFEKSRQRRTRTGALPSGLIDEDMMEQGMTAREVEVIRTADASRWSLEISAAWAPIEEISVGYSASVGYFRIAPHPLLAVYRGVRSSTGEPMEISNDSPAGEDIGGYLDLGVRGQVASHIRLTSSVGLVPYIRSGLHTMGLFTGSLRWSIEAGLGFELGELW